MGPLVINGRLWRVVGAEPGDPRLIDREGRLTIGTADPRTETIHVSKALMPPLLDKVLLHEVAHAITMSYGLLGGIGQAVENGDRIGAEEWAAQLVESHGIEAAQLTSEALGRPVCVRGFCHD